MPVASARAIAAARARPQALAAMHSGHPWRAGSRWSWGTSGCEAVADLCDGARTVLQATRRDIHKRSISGACPRGEAPRGYRPGWHNAGTMIPRCHPGPAPADPHTALGAMCCHASRILIIGVRWIRCLAEPALGGGHTRTARRYRCAVVPRSPVPWARMMGPAIAVPRGLRVYFAL